MKILSVGLFFAVSTMANMAYASNVVGPVHGTANTLSVQQQNTNTVQPKTRRQVLSELQDAYSDGEMMRLKHTVYKGL